MGVILLSIKGEFICEYYNRLCFLYEAPFQIFRMQRVPLDVEELRVVILLHDLHLDVRVQPLRHHHHAMPIVVAVVLMEEFLKEIEESRLADSPYEHDVGHLIDGFVLAAGVH